MKAAILELAVNTSGNPIKNLIWGLLYRGELKAINLLDNMHIQDAENRMMLLGAEILRQNISADGIKDFVRKAPSELQNPIDETPFQWNSQGAYLWLDPPVKNIAQRKFHINTKR